MRRLLIDDVAVAGTFLVALLLTLLSLAMALSWLPVVHETRVLWDTATEANIWTWTSVTVLMLGAYAHLATAYLRWNSCRSAAFLWVMTAGLLAAMSLDDLAALHERLFHYGVLLGGGAGLTFFAWVIPGAFVALGICIAFGFLIRKLYGRPRRYLVSGLAIFFGGALGVEMIGASVTEQEGYSNLYVVIYHIEEMMEALGASLLLGAGLADLPEERRTLSYWLSRKSHPAN